LGKSGRLGVKGGVVDLVDKDTEEGGSLLTRVGQKLRLGIGDEYGSNSGEQNSLVPSLAHAHWNLV